MKIVLYGQLYRLPIVPQRFPCRLTCFRTRLSKAMVSIQVRACREARRGHQIRLIDTIQDIVCAIFGRCGATQWESLFPVRTTRQIEQLASMKQMCMWISAMRLVVALVSIECFLSHNGAGRSIDSCMRGSRRRVDVITSNKTELQYFPLRLLFCFVYSFPYVVRRPVRLCTQWHINRIKAR